MMPEVLNVLGHRLHEMQILHLLLSAHSALIH